MLARNTLVQLLALYTNPESHNTQRHRQTDVRIMLIADHTVYKQCDRLKTHHCTSRRATITLGLHDGPKSKSVYSCNANQL